MTKEEEKSTVTTIAGSHDGTSGYNDDSTSTLRPCLHYPTGMAVLNDNTIFVTDQKNQRLIRIDKRTNLNEYYTLSTIMGDAQTQQFDGDDGVPLACKPGPEGTCLNHPAQVVVRSMPYGRIILYFTDKDNHRICRIIMDSDGNNVTSFTTLAGSLEGEGSLQNDGEIRFQNPMGMALIVDNDHLCTMYIADIANHAIRKLSFVDDGTDVKNVECTTVMGGSDNAGCQDGAFEAAKLHYPLSVALDDTNRYLYVADFANNRVVEMDLKLKNAKTLAGSATGEAGCADGIGEEARFTMPTCVYVQGKYVYVTDWTNHRVCQIHVKTQEVSTILGSSGEKGCSQSLLNNPGAIVVRGKSVFLADTGNNRICISEVM